MVLRQQARPLYRATCLGVALATSIFSAGGEARPTNEVVLRAVRAANGRPSRGLSATGSSSSSGSSSSAGAGAGRSSPSSETLICPGSSSLINNQECDDINNNEYCGYDGGDCCSCTCSGSECDAEGRYVNCIDPAAACLLGEDGDDGDERQFSSSGRAASADDDRRSSSLSCTGGFASYVGDGTCDGFLNTAECDWDGGDCCLEGDCSKCIDPDVLVALSCSSEKEEKEEEEEEEGALSRSSSSGSSEQQGGEAAVSRSSSSGSSEQQGEDEAVPVSTSSSGSLNQQGEGGKAVVSTSSSFSGSPLPSPSPAAWPSHLDGSGSKKDTTTTIVVALGVAFLMASGVAFLSVSYSRIANMQKEALAAEAAESSANGGRGGARTAQSTPIAAAVGFRVPEA